ncbi:unnamed protein product [Protopolystoma xenopodis]|uniref:Uncharacterized protein n=1 Tax=Protopolystoma xenopodis TaxID=117903 RepID=A0A448XIA3_9PLAT|nr:unnamed protein product [Protopolystoma xenopodis]
MDSHFFWTRFWRQQVAMVPCRSKPMEICDSASSFLMQELSDLTDFEEHGRSARDVNTSTTGWDRLLYRSPA